MRYGKPSRSPRAQVVNPGPASSPRPAPHVPPPTPVGDATDEAAIQFDPVDGHDHDGSNSHTVDHGNLAGVGADDHHAQVHALFSTDHSDVDDTDTPTSGDVLTFDGTNWVAAPPSTSGAATKSPLGAWGKANISALGTTDEEIPNTWTAGASDTLPRKLSGAGDLLVISVTMDAAISGGGSVTFTVYKSGSATALTITLSGAEQEKNAAVTVPFADGDLIRVYAKRTGTISNTPKATAVVEGRYS